MGDEISWQVKGIDAIKFIFEGVLAKPIELGTMAVSAGYVINVFGGQLNSLVASVGEHIFEVIFGIM